MLLFEYIRENFNIDGYGFLVRNIIDWTNTQSMDREDTISTLVELLNGIGITKEEIEKFYG